MAVTMEQVEKLREKSGATYEECRDALEQAGGNLLDAIILLERAGRSRTAGATFTTRPGEKAAEAARLVLSPESGRDGGKRRSDWRDGAAEVWEAGKNLLRHAVLNQFEVWRRGELMTSMPVLILVLLVVLVFWISLPLLIIGLFLGCRYRFAGPDLEKNPVNDVMDTVSDTVGGMVDEARREFSDGKKEKAPPAGEPDREAQKRERRRKAQAAGEKAARAAEKATGAAEKAVKKAAEAAQRAEVADKAIDAVDKALGAVDKKLEELDRWLSGGDKKE